MKQGVEAVSLIADGIFSKALQVRRMIQRGENEALRLPLTEIAVLARRLEPLLSPDELAAALESVSFQRWASPTFEVGIQEGYAKWAEGYDDEKNPLIEIEEPITLELIGDVADKDVLDAACGTGRYALKLAQAGARVCGIDATAEMLACAKQKQAALGLPVDFRLGDLTQLPFADASFDVAVCALMLCHAPDLHAVMKEMSRVLRPGGRLVISDFHPFCLQVGWRTLFRRPKAMYYIENHIHLTQDYLNALFANGFKLIALREEIVDDRLLTIWSEIEVERFRGLPAALVIAGGKV